jgi:hypothetical protein
MTFIRDNLPDTSTYFEGEGLILTGPRSAKWKTTRCEFHGGSDSMRINTTTGAWVCMSCGEKGGDVPAHHMAAHGLEFIEAAKVLGCWQDDGQPHTPQKPKPLQPGAALSVLAYECTLIAVAAGNIARGVQLTTTDLNRVLQAAGRVNSIKEAYQ